MATVSDLSEGHPNCQKPKIEIDQVVSWSPVQEFHSSPCSESGNVFGPVLTIGQGCQMEALLWEHRCEPGSFTLGCNINSSPDTNPLW